MNNKETSQCEKAELFYYDFIESKIVPGEIYEHISSCQDCNVKVHELTQILAELKENSELQINNINMACFEMLDLHFAYCGKKITCATVKPFLPSLANPCLNIRVVTPITKHIEHCEKCQHDLESIKQLCLNSEQLSRLSVLFSKKMTTSSADCSHFQHVLKSAEVWDFKDIAPEQLQTITDIERRPESGIVTIYRLNTEENDKRYEKIVDFVKTAKNRLPLKEFKPILKIGIAAAFIITVAVLFSNLSTASASTLEQIYKAIATIKNAHISKFVAGSTEPLQEIWVSRTLQVYVTKSQNEIVLWDLFGRTRKTMVGENAFINTTQLSDSAVNEIAELKGNLGLVPFDTIAQVPRDAHWEKINESSINHLSEGLDVYELSWEKQAYDGSKLSYKWRFYIDTKDYVPVRTEFYRKGSGELDYSLTTSNELRPLDEDDISAIVEQYFPLSGTPER